MLTSWVDVKTPSRPPPCKRIVSVPKTNFIKRRFGHRPSSD
jgi:hypothetical protein